MVNPKRVRPINNKPFVPIKDSGSQYPVIYWMSRDQRVKDNWALICAADFAKKSNQPLVVVFCLVEEFLEATDRQFGFMIEGLRQVEQNLKELNISMVLLKGKPEVEVVKFASSHNATLIITDFSPLKVGRDWRDVVAKKVSCPMLEVDAHNVVPVWITSTKQEFGAYTIRPKIHKQLEEFLEAYPKLEKIKHAGFKHAKPCDWPKIKSDISLESGEEAAHKELGNFIKNKLQNYDLDRNDPTKDAQSNLSAYLHFGQISAQRVALEVLKHVGKPVDEVMLPDRNGSKRESNEAAFLEELIVRRELSDNFCFYNKNYNNTQGFPDWAKKTIEEHQKDVREYIYTKKQFEEGKTHDDLWNAAQLQMVKTGKMHGYMRMYWAKKILEWTSSASDAMKIAIYLNDKYELDGRDSNGYAGIAWSIGGVHDRAWFDREIYGKIRYMSYNGCKSKFNIDNYIKLWLKEEN